MKRGLAVTGALATVAAMGATTLVATIANAAGVEFEIPEGGVTIPLPGFATMTGIWSVVGVVIAAATRRWSARPVQRFVQTTVVLTAVSLVAPLISGARAATTATLIALHLVAASVMVPTLTRALGQPTTANQSSTTSTTAAGASSVMK